MSEDGGRSDKTLSVLLAAFPGWDDYPLPPGAGRASGFPGLAILARGASPLAAL